MRYWLGVVSRQHVRRGVELGIAQVGHGKRSPLERMEPGDGLVYYSPRDQLRAGTPVKAFTALGRIVDAEVWQADEGSFRPWRRRVDYLEGREAPIGPLLGVLDLTSSPHWGHALRRGLLDLTEHDFEVIRRSMASP